MTKVTSAQVVRDIQVLRKRHENERHEGFSGINETVNPFSMFTGGKAGEGYQFRN